MAEKKTIVYFDFGTRCFCATACADGVILAVFNREVRFNGDDASKKENTKALKEWFSSLPLPLFLVILEEEQRVLFHHFFPALELTHYSFPSFPVVPRIEKKETVEKIMEEMKQTMQQPLPLLPPLDTRSDSAVMKQMHKAFLEEELASMFIH